MNVSLVGNPFIGARGPPTGTSLVSGVTIDQLLDADLVVNGGSIHDQSHS